MIEILDKKNTIDVNLFINGLNLAFKERCNEQIPYEAVSKDEILASGDSLFVFCYRDGENIIGGLCLKKELEYSNIATGKIFHVWSHPNYRGKGIARQLMEYAEMFAKNNSIDLLQLNVANIYKPAVNLYKRCGYKKLMIYANEPKTYYFIRMFKQIKPGTLSKLFILKSRIKSYCTFHSFFKNDSTPRLIGKLVFRFIKNKED